VTDQGDVELTIERIETIPVVAPLTREFRGSNYRMDSRATMVTRVYARNGLVGEAYAGDEAHTLPQIDSAIIKEIAPRIQGMNLMAIQAIWAAAYPVTFDILRDRRIGLVALACVDTAIWDAVGKALGVSLHTLWGGAKDRVPTIVIGGYYGEPFGPIADEIAEYRAMCMAGVKFKIGGASPETDAARVRAARDAAGADFVIAVDANQGYTHNEAVEFAERTRDLNLRWFEEPVGWANDRLGMAALRSRAGIAICAGQSEMSPAGCRDLMQEGAIDICNFDASWSGGPTAWLRTAAIAHSYGLEMAHHEEPHVASHLVASQPHGTYAEVFHPDRDPFWWNLVANRPPLVDGHLQLPDRPGLGWELDQDYLDKYRVDRG
jgi:L-alanine-DL-glutamate epimerase-like enolase superfamily enzyme